MIDSSNFGKRFSVNFDYLRIFLWLFCYTVIGIIIVLLACRNVGESKLAASYAVGKYPTVVIDAGHGGFDGGAVSENGILEKDINLDISLRLASLFELSDIPCVLTRDSDTELVSNYNGSKSRKRGDLMARAEICESVENAVFISIHQNKFPSSRYRGLQVFYSRNNRDSELLARSIKESNCSLIDGENKRDIKPSGSEIYLLDRIKAPAVLVECGFLSNSAEAQLLSDKEYQKKLALMLYSAITSYIYNENKDINM